MAIRKLSLASISAGVKSSNFWDGTSALPGIKGFSYVLGGYDGGGFENKIQKFDLYSATIATLSATLDQGFYYGAGVSNSNVAGYSMSPAQSNGTPVGYAPKVTYSTDVRTNTSTGLTPHGGGRTGMSNTGTAGYSGGGYNNGNLNQISKVNFSNDACSTIGATTSSTKREITQGGNKGTAGYMLGGYADGWTTGIDKLTYSNESRSTIGTSLPSAGGGCPSNVDTETALYMFGDQYVSVNGARIWKLTFSSDAGSTLSATLSTKRNTHAAGQSKGFAAYVMGGLGVSNVYLNSIERFNFATSVVSSVSTVLAYTPNAPSSFSNELSI
jgi:hypothetical protein